MMLRFPSLRKWGSKRFCFTVACTSVALGMSIAGVLIIFGVTSLLLLAPILLVFCYFPYYLMITGTCEDWRVTVTVHLIQTFWARLLSASDECQLNALSPQPWVTPPHPRGSAIVQKGSGKFYRYCWRRNSTHLSRYKKTPSHI